MADFKADGCILTGSLTEAAAGVPFIDAGTNITTAVNANGSITINSTAGGTVDGSGTATELAYWSDSDTLTSNASMTWSGGKLYIGESGTGSDVIFYGHDASATGLHWDSDYAEHGALLLGTNDHGVDFVVRGETANHFLMWDQSVDTLKLVGHFIFNEGALDLKFRAESQNIPGMIIIDSGTDQLLLHSSGSNAASAGGAGIPAGSDVATYISGTAGSAGVAHSKGVALVAGDLVVSGTIYEQAPATLSFYTTSDSNAMTTKTSIFDEDNYGSFTKTDMITANNIDFVQSTGAFRIRQSRPHMVTMTLAINNTSAGPSDTVTVSVEADSTEIYTAAYNVHGSVDPVERTVSFLIAGPTAAEMVAGTYKELIAYQVTSNGNTNFKAGTSMTIYAI